jgi:hypothetical protein
MIAACASQAMAQERRQLGVTFGASLASVEREQGALAQDPYSGRAGLTAGLFAHLPVRDRIHLQIETLFTDKGGSVPLVDPSIVSGTATLRYKLHYLDVPVLARVRGPRIRAARLHAFGGPTFSVRLAASRQTAISGQGSFGFEREIDDEVERFDLGVTLGGGVEISRAIFNLRYTHGFSEVLEDIYGSRLSNRGVLVTAGVRIF